MSITGLADIAIQLPPPPPPPPPPPEPVDASVGQANPAEPLPPVPTPEGVKPEVQAQVDTVLAATATPEQRQQAYQAVQGYVDEVGGVGDAGIVEEAIPQKAAEVLQQ